MVVSIFHYTYITRTLPYYPNTVGAVNLRYFEPDVKPDLQYGDETSNGVG